MVTDLPDDMRVFLLGILIVNFLILDGERSSCWQRGIRRIASNPVLSAWYSAVGVNMHFMLAFDITYLTPDTIHGSTMYWYTKTSDLLAISGSNRMAAMYPYTCSIFTAKPPAHSAIPAADQ